MCFSGLLLAPNPLCFFGPFTRPKPLIFGGPRGRRETRKGKSTIKEGRGSIVGRVLKDRSSSRYYIMHVYLFNFINFIGKQAKIT